MESNAINKKERLSVAEKQAISKSLIDAGIDPALVKSLVAEVDPNCNAAGPCWHTHKCNGYTNKSNKLDQLKKEIVAKRIDVKKLDPAVQKLLK